MSTFNSIVTKFARIRDERRGVTALEYGLIASLVAIAIVAALTTLGTNLTAEFNYIAGKI
jgi:pilus assembly protein Flp/PilA